MGCIMSTCTETNVEHQKDKATSIIKDVKKLKDCNYANTERFNFKNKTFEAKVVKVYDGDTITVVFMILGEYYKFNIRMDGYDSPEIRSKNIDEKKWAIASRDFLTSLIMDKIILLRCKDYDKYGRILGIVELNGIDINKTMLDRGYCRPYNGGNKKTWDFSEFDKMYLNNGIKKYII